MAHFAKIDENNIVTTVLVVDNSLEHRGEDFLANDMGLGGRWIQTSYNNNFRKRFASPGYLYDEINDVFIEPQPYPSWILDENWDWQPPIPKPQEIFTEEHILLWEWNEENQNWDKFEQFS